MTHPEIRKDLAKGAFLRLCKNDDGSFQLVGKTAKNRKCAGERIPPHEVAELLCVVLAAFASVDDPSARTLVAEIVGFAEEAQAAYPELIPAFKHIIARAEALHQLPINREPSPKEVN